MSTSQITANSLADIASISSNCDKALRILRISSGGASRSPSEPRHGVNGSRRAFSSTNPNCPGMYQRLSERSTQSTISAIPTIPPRNRSATVGLATLSRPRSRLSGIRSSLCDAWIRTGPRYLVDQTRFSTSLWPATMKYAHGCRIERNFIVPTLHMELDVENSLVRGGTQKLAGSGWFPTGVAQ